MASTLEAKIQAGVQAFGPLVAILAARPDGAAAIYELQEYQGTGFPSMTFFLVSTVTPYGNAFRSHIVQSRVQFTIWDTNPERGRAVETQLMAFLDQFNAYNATPANVQRPNTVVMRRQGGNPQTQPLTFWRMLDAMIWNNEDL
jgi:hypothetical protein